jgi:FkbM family methyltransferase
MTKNNLIKKISYNPVLIKSITLLHLRSILRKVYYFLNHPQNGILEISLAGISSKFLINNPDEFRLTESVTGENGEKKVLEKFISLIKKGDVVYDVGANTGVYSIFLAKSVGINGKIVAFEPEIESIKKLKENIKLNDINNIFIVEKALGEKNEISKLYIGKTTGNFSLVNLYEKEEKYQQVDIVNGDELIEKIKLPIPKALKIDVEGYEYSVLFGLKNTLQNTNCKIICCEIHLGLFPEGITDEKIIDLIKSFGFSKIEIFKRAFSAYHIIAQKD